LIRRVNNGPAGVRKAGLDLTARVEAGEGDPAQVADAWRQLQPDQVEQGEVDQGGAVGVGGVFCDGQVGLVAEDLVEHVWELPLGRADDFGAEHGVLVGDAGIR
jgi:hypothetical protein